MSLETELSGSKRARGRKDAMEKGLAVRLVIVWFPVRDRECGGEGLLLVEKQSDPILIKEVSVATAEVFANGKIQITNARADMLLYSSIIVCCLFNFIKCKSRELI